jgi:HSP20 family protein
MPYQTLYKNETTIYPGEYTPSEGMETLANDSGALDHKTIPGPAFNLNEYGECYRLEVDIPGVSRQDIILRVKDNMLNITALNNNREILPEASARIHEFDSYIYESSIRLPENADTEFMAAEYREGVLRVHFPKMEMASQSCNKQVVVY